MRREKDFFNEESYDLQWSHRAAAMTSLGGAGRKRKRKKESRMNNTEENEV